MFPTHHRLGFSPGMLGQQKLGDQDHKNCVRIQTCTGLSPGQGGEGGRASDAPGQNHRDNFSVANLVTIIFSLSFFSLSLPVSFSR